MVSSDKKILLQLTFAEYEGIGTWYEYLAKYKHFKKLKEIKNILIAGLPQEYGISSEMILFSINGCNITVLDNRKNKLESFKKIAEKFNVADKIKLVYSENLEKFPFKDNSFDLVLNTEVIQRVNNHKKMVQEMERVSSKHIFVFASNAYYYAHYLITKIKTFKLKELKKYCSLKIIDSGYLDRPPWPAGVAISSSKISFTEGSKSKERETYEKENKKDNFLISLIKNIFISITPSLVVLESLCPSPFREMFSHICYVHLIKK